MSEFTGFPDRMEYTSVPNVLINEVLLKAGDAGLIKVVLYTVARLYRKRGYPKYVTGAELSGDAALMQGLGDDSDSAVIRWLDEAVARHVLLECEVADAAGTRDRVFMLNTPNNKTTMGKIAGGEIVLPGRQAAAAVYEPAPPPPDIFTLYEQNIGVLTPLIAEQIKELLARHGENWLRDAVSEAVALNKRNIRYITRILENWGERGRTDGAYRAGHKTDPDKYIRGKYGHVVRR